MRSKKGSGAKEANVRGKRLEPLWWEVKPTLLGLVETANRLKNCDLYIFGIIKRYLRVSSRGCKWRAVGIESELWAWKITATHFFHSSSWFLPHLRSLRPLPFHFRSPRQEINAFGSWICSTAEGDQSRQATVLRFKNAIEGKWPSTKVSCYGSQITGTYLPNGQVQLKPRTSSPKRE